MAETEQEGSLIVSSVSESAASSSSAAATDAAAPDAVDAGGESAPKAEVDAADASYLSPYDTYKKSAAGRNRTNVKRKTFTELDTTNLAKAGDVLRHLNERRDDRTYQRNEFHSLKDDLKRKGERIHDIHEVMIGKSGAAHRTPVSSLRDKYGFKYDINQAESNLRVAPEYPHPPFWKSFPLASVPVEVDPLYYPYYYEPYYLRYKPDRLRRRLNGFKDYGLELHNKVTDATMEVERLSHLVDSIDKEQAAVDTSHCAQCCDSNQDLEFLALMAHHRSHSVPHYPMSRYYARATLRHSTTPSVVTSSTYPRLPVSVPRSASVGPSASATIRRNRFRRSVSPSFLPSTGGAAGMATTTSPTTKSVKSSSRFLGDGLQRNRNKTTRRGTSPGSGYSIPVSLMVPKLRKVLGGNMTAAVVNDDEAPAVATSAETSATKTASASSASSGAAAATAAASEETEAEAEAEAATAPEEAATTAEEAAAADTVAKAVSQAATDVATAMSEFAVAATPTQSVESEREDVFTTSSSSSSQDVSADLTATLAKKEEEEDEFVKRESVSEAFSMQFPTSSSSSTSGTQVVIPNESGDDESGSGTMVSTSTFQLTPSSGDSSSNTKTTTTTMETSTTEEGSNEPVVRRQQVTIVEDRYSSSSDLSSSDVDDEVPKVSKTTVKIKEPSSSSSSSSSSDGEGEEKQRKGILKKGEE